MLSEGMLQELENTLLLNMLIMLRVRGLNLLSYPYIVHCTILDVNM